MNEPSHPASPSATKRPPRQSRKGLTSTGARKAASKSPRSRSREFALQALYQLMVGKNDLTEVDLFTRDLAGFSKADTSAFRCLAAWLFGQAQRSTPASASCSTAHFRKFHRLSMPSCGSALTSFQHCLDVPWRVVLNECIELAKEFGGTDGHKYVNGVLNTLARQLRAAEVTPDRQPSHP